MDMIIKPLSDAELAELRRLYAAIREALPGGDPRQPGQYVVAWNKASGAIMDAFPGLNARLEELQAYRDAETTRCAKADCYDRICEHLGVESNVLGAIADKDARLEAAEAYRNEVEAARPTVQALLDSGERAASEVADLRQRLEDAEREQQRVHELANRLLDANNGLIDTIRKLDPEALCDWHDGIGGDEYLQRWIADRDAQQRRKGAAKWFAEHRDYNLSAMEQMEKFTQAAKRLREGGE